MDRVAVQPVPGEVVKQTLAESSRLPRCSLPLAFSK